MSSNEPEPKLIREALIAEIKDVLQIAEKQRNEYKKANSTFQEND